MGIELEAAFASVHKGGHHVRVALDLLNVCDPPVSGVVLEVGLLPKLDHRLGCSLLHLLRLCFLLLLLDLISFLVLGFLAWIWTGHGKELTELLFDRPGQGGHLSIILGPQVLLELVNLRVELPKVDLDIVLLLHLIEDLKERHCVEDGREAEHLLLPMVVHWYFVNYEPFEPARGEDKGLELLRLVGCAFVSEKHL